MGVGALKEVCSQLREEFKKVRVFRVSVYDCVDLLLQCVARVLKVWMRALQENVEL